MSARYGQVLVAVGAVISRSARRHVAGIRLDRLREDRDPWYAQTPGRPSEPDAAQRSTICRGCPLAGTWRAARPFRRRSSLSGAMGRYQGAATPSVSTARLATRAWRGLRTPTRLRAPLCFMRRSSDWSATALEGPEISFLTNAFFVPPQAVVYG